MERLLVTVVCVFALSSCTTPSVQQNAPAPPDDGTFQAQLKQGLLTTCRFVPTATALANILGVVTPGVDEAAKIAAEICKLVDNQTKGAPIKFRGVVVHGSKKPI